MKRFYKDVGIAPLDGHCTVMLDGRPIKTQGGQPLLLPGGAMARLLAGEWEAQGEDIDPSAFRYRDMADYALDVVGPDPAALVDKLLGYAETDTLCYRADPEEPLYRRQQEVWEPLLSALEAREGVTLSRVSGVLHRAQPRASMETLRAKLAKLDPFTLAALEQLTSLSASLGIGLAALEEDADAEALWDAANLEEDWQGELWGKDWETEERRTKRKADFLAAVEFAKAVRSSGNQ